MAYFINKEDCTACGRCGGVCKFHAIAPFGEAEIDPSKCTDCGACVDSCPLGAIVKEGEAPTPVVSHEQIELECDLVVIGGGGGGLMAAARAAWLSGKKVIVLEKMKKCGGGAWFASTMKMFGSKWQKDRGAPDNLNETLIKVMDETYWKLDSHLALNALRGTGEFFDWLGEVDPKRDECFEQSFYVFDGPDGPMTPAYKFGKGPHENGSGWYIITKMQEVLKSCGGEILLQHRATGIEMKDGKVCAVIATDPGGTTRIKCKACIMSPGSWINNQEILDKYVPEYGRLPRQKGSHTHIAYTGDGFPLAKDANAYIDEESLCLRLMGGAGMAPSQSAMAMSTGPYAVYVNLNGKRWINELTMGRSGFFKLATALIHQPEGRNFCIFDMGMVAEAAKRPFINIWDKYSPIPVMGVTDNYEQEILDAAKRFPDMLISAETIEGLAEKLGIAPAALAGTVKRYNEMCEQGRDDDFFKSPEHLIPFGNGPFFAVGEGVSTDGAFGGVLVNENIQAYAADKNTVIENLYVPGDFASGRFLNMCGYKVQIINDISWAFSSGFIAGTHAAKQLIK